MLIMVVLLSTVAFLGVVYVGIAYLASSETLHPRRQPVIGTPKEYGLEYEDVEFKSTDGISLKGWLVGSDSRDSRFRRERVIILVHASTFNRHGWSPRRWYESLYHQPDVDFMPMVRALSECGYSILMFDLGNHGDSEGRKVVGFGLNEYQDVAGAVDYMRSRYAQYSPRVGIIAACLGANSTIIAMSKAREHLRNVAFLILLQPVTPSVFIRRFMKSVYTPLAFAVYPLAERLCRWRGGFGIDDVSPQQYAADVDVPTLHVQAEEDPWTTLDDVRRIYEAIKGPKELWLLEGKMKRFDTYVCLARNPQRIIDFAGKHFSEDLAVGETTATSDSRISPLV